MPGEFPVDGPIANHYRRMKGRLIARCRETKGDFRWGQNAFRHSYGTYGLALFQSADRISRLMGDRDVDTLYNYYAEYETQERGREYFSIGSAIVEPLPLTKVDVKLLKRLMREVIDEGPNLAQFGNG